MLPPPTAIHFAQRNRLYNKDNNNQLTSALFILPPPSAGLHTPEESFQRPAEPPIYAKLLEEEDWRASGILHDFNNQLAIILSHCSIALTKLPPDSNARANLERSVKATKRAADLSSQLQIGRLAQADEYTETNVNDLLRETVEEFEPRLNVDTTLEQTYAAALPSIAASRTLLQRALHIILNNAAEAMYRRKGKIIVQTEKVVVATDSHQVPYPLPQGSYALVEVRDEGLGMDQATLDHIFEPYFSTKASGSGLGLTIALHIIQLHHGIIYVSSKKEEGTRFQIFLPLAQNGYPPAES